MSESDLVNPSQLSTKLEAILYLKAQPLSIQDLADYAICEIEDVEEALLTLMQDYALRNSALEVVETNSGFSLQLREAYMSLVQTIVPTDLGVGALRTLAAIALKGPIPQTQLVELRGSGAYQHVGDLAEEGFVSKRRQSNGRSYSVQVTEKFYQYFEVDELPKLKLKKSAKRRRVVEEDEAELESTSTDVPQESEVQETSSPVEGATVNTKAEAATKTEKDVPEKATNEAIESPSSDDAKVEQENSIQVAEEPPAEPEILPQSSNETMETTNTSSQTSDKTQKISQTETEKAEDDTPQLSQQSNGD